MFQTSLRRCIPSTRLLLRGGGDRHHSHHHHDSPPVHPSDYAPSDFNTPFWRNIFIGSLSFFVLYYANDYYDSIKGSDVVHPITAYINYHMTDEREWKKINYAGIKEMEKGAADTLLLQELPGGRKVPRIVAPELLERASPFGISAGTQADLSDLVIKN